MKRLANTAECKKSHVAGSPVHGFAPNDLRYVRGDAARPVVASRKREMVQGNWDRGYMRARPDLRRA